VDVPSDRPYGTAGTDPFKVSKEHLEDVKKVIDFVSQKWSEPIFLIGHSAGTTSVAYLATVLKDNRIGGVVLTSALGNSAPGRVSLATLPLQGVTYPVLLCITRRMSVQALPPPVNNTNASSTVLEFISLRS
jgi:pimeloyl-ACP methyl ester carboxylesterase